MQFLIVLLVILITFIQIKSQDITHNQRELDSCSSYTSCDSCFKDSSCVFLNNSCVSASSSTISSDSYLSLESLYCNNYTPSGQLIINNSSDSLSLYPNSNSSYKDHPTCIWSISNPSLSQISLNFQRSSSNYEDIYVLYKYNSRYYYMSTKQIASCSSSSVTFLLSNVTSLIVKVKRLSAKSDYSININKSFERGEHNDYTLAIIIICSLLSVIIAMVVAFIIMVCYFRRIERRYLDQRKYVPPNPQYVEETLSRMNSCLFKHCEPKYKQDSCVICLEQYEPDSQISITNECNHIFHSECLKTWYLNIRGDRKLTCPHCSTENSPKSQPLESCEFPSMASIHLENFPVPIISERANPQNDEDQIISSNRV